MTRAALLSIRFTSYWLSGTGTAQGRRLNAVTYRDRDGCPAMPMTQVKGQLRETAERLARGGDAGWNAQLVELLFGSRAAGGGDIRELGVADTRSVQGALGFRGDARLSATLCEVLRGEEGKPSRLLLFRRLAATRIDDRGVAEDKSLRAVEAVVPVTLEGQVELILDLPQDIDWVRLLDAACAATLAFGKLKADGYGRAIAMVEARS
jgi:hypothetical protein